jgi:hypothetical protein
MYKKVRNNLNLQCVEEEIDPILEGCYNVWKKRSIPFLRDATMCGRGDRFHS